MTIDIADLADSGITAAQLISTSEGADTLALTVAAAIDSAALLAPFEQLTLTDGATTRFVGWCDQAPRAATGNAQSHSYILAGPWRWLDRTNWQSETTGGKVLLTTLDEENQLSPLDTSIRAILDKVITETSGAIAYVDSDLNLAVLQHQIPPEIRWDSQCGDLLRRALSYAPTVSYYWDYTTTVPTIRFVDAGGTTADKTLSATTYQLSAASLNRRYDLLRDCVVIYWLQNDDIILTDDSTDATGDAHSLSAARTLIKTFENGAYNVPAAGLAAALLKYYSRLHTDATATMVGLDWTHRPGHLWSFSGILAAGTKSIATQITRDLANLTQSLTLGVPPALGIYKLATATPPPGNDPDKKTATVTRTILDPNDAAIDGAQYYIGTQIAPSGSPMTIAPGSYTINFIVPPDYLPPAPESITLAKDDESSSSVRATFRYRLRLRLRAADGSGTEEVDINVDDLADGAGAAGFVLNERCDGKQAWFLQTPWTTPA